MRMKPHSLVGWSLENIQNEFWRNDGNALCDWLVSTNAAGTEGLLVDIKNLYLYKVIRHNYF